MTTDPKDAEIARLMAERRMIVSHATMGQTDGEGLSVNAISVKITALRNELYQDGAARAEKAEAALAENEAAAEGAFMILAQTQAERDAALAQVARLHHLITEASDPDFIWGAMDNVNDMDVGLDEFANAASRAIRASIPILAAAEKEASP